MNLIDQKFEQLRQQNQKAFIPFLTAGDPDMESTLTLAQELIQAGASILEIGFPYSDAIADGPVIQASYTRALEKGLKIDDVFAGIQKLAQSDVVRAGQIPLVGMLSYSLVQRRGVEAFCAKAKEVGLSGLIIPDLPYEESANAQHIAKESGLKLIYLVTPTTSPDRSREIALASTGFLYCVSVAGITGERDSLPEELIEQLAWLRSETDVPLCVGFGISKPEHVRMLRDHVDGVIVGSAFVRRLEQVDSRSFNEITGELTDLTRALVAAFEQ